ncbi:MAG: hypothetical protein FJ263_10795 [Planctomycetes bacterium]|nr:hypothetical protein [Planctomycetota bacterium]
MALLHKDIDILKHDPGLFTASTPYMTQSFGKGANGVLSNTSFTVSGGNFQTAGVQAGHVIYIQSLDGMINGVYEIAAVVSNTALTVSAPRAETTDPAIPIGSGSGLIWRIITFAPQAAEAAFTLSQRLGLKPGCPDSQYGFENLTNMNVLKQASVYTALAIIYSGMYASGASDGNIWSNLKTKLDYYKDCAEAAIGCCRLGLNI